MLACQSQHLTLLLGVFADVAGFLCDALFVSARACLKTAYKIRPLFDTRPACTLRVLNPLALYILQALASEAPFFVKQLAVSLGYPIPRLGCHR